MNKTTSQTPAKVTTAPSGLLQRVCACGQHTGAGGCSTWEKERLPRSTRNPQHETQNTNEVPPVVHEVLRSPGQPLDAATRNFFEPRFGRDFSRVRVHTDTKAAESARAVSALAYTVGQHIVLGHDQTSGRLFSRYTMAHELAHSIQQASNDVHSSKINIGSTHDSAEREADVAAEAIVRGDPSVASLGLKSSNSLQRKAVAPPSSFSREIVFPYTNATVNPSGLPSMTFRSNDFADAEDACSAITEITVQGEVDINGGCANAKTATTYQQRLNAAMIATAAADSVLTQIREGVFGGLCGELLDPRPAPMDASGLSEHKPKIVVHQFPPGDFPLSPGEVASIFPDLRPEDNVKVKVRST